MSYLICIGIAIIVGYIVGRLVQLLKIPSVAGYVIAGVVLGNSVLHILGDTFIESVGVINDIALGIIAFTIGGELVVSTLKKIGGKVFVIAFLESFMAFALVVGAMLILKQDIATSLLLGAVAAATAPAATLVVINELKAKGILTSTLLAVVALDDAICLMIYAIAASIAKVLVFGNTNVDWVNVIASPFIEIGGSILLGIIIGLIFVFIFKFCRDSKDVLILALAAILIMTGLSHKLELSSLLCNMTMGIIVANLSKQQKKVFHVLESISAPIYVAFFVIAGARLQLNMMVHVGLIGLVYTLARGAGKIGGASLGATITGAQKQVRNFIGFGLISQIGVAVGLAIVISHEFVGTKIGNLIITILLSTTIITEIVGPLMAKFALIKSGEAQKACVNINNNETKGSPSTKIPKGSIPQNEIKYQGT